MTTIKKPRKGASLKKVLEYCKAYYKQGDEVYPVDSEGVNRTTKLVVDGEIRIYPAPNSIEATDMCKLLYCKGVYAEKITKPKFTLEQVKELFPVGTEFHPVNLVGTGFTSAKHTITQEDFDNIQTYGYEGNTSYFGLDGYLWYNGTFAKKVPQITKQKEMNTILNYQTLENLWVKQVGLKVGDYVKVLFKVPSYAQGWDNSFTSQMEVWVGKTLKVENLNTNNMGITLGEPGSISTQGFPYFCLEKVEKPVQKVKLNEQYTAEVISKTMVKVGCQEIPVSAIKKLLKEVETF